ncbi:hypothetical protein EVAR_77657_1 [Eumeta japonica]|uniref:Uncharacterized protein n=1 Tax=Eumeta variegata TaxID=151549 RepID=A0A4C1T780_EUMVA|nr:hypothetical protein EVAR_77657_1 [Eumeta japonica]
MINVREMQKRSFDFLVLYDRSVLTLLGPSRALRERRHREKHDKVPRAGHVRNKVSQNANVLSDYLKRDARSQRYFRPTAESPLHNRVASRRWSSVNWNFRNGVVREITLFESLSGTGTSSAGAPHFSHPLEDFSAVTRISTDKQYRKPFVWRILFSETSAYNISISGAGAITVYDVARHAVST